MKPLAAIFLIVLFFCAKATAQNGCSALGQTPKSAFPVCGSSVFKQTSVPICINSSLTIPGCSDGSAYGDKNPFWYKFTCYQSGTLSFLIEPNNPGDDYDWELYDVTGHDPGDVYTNTKLIVTGNWAGTYGNTGASSDGVAFTQCSSNPLDNKPTFARSPKIIAGHHYILLVSHFTDSQDGYSLSFKGGSAVITDTLTPGLTSAVPACDATTLSIGLNKSLNCNSMAVNGSDFTLSPAVAKIVRASSTDCSDGFDMDSLTLTFDKPLPPGDYTITIKNGSDHNTLLDQCGNAVPTGEHLAFKVQEIPPTPMDSIPQPGCAPQTVEVVFDGPMRCNSVAKNGSDFEITGPSPVSILSAAAADCNNGLSSVVTLTLQEPIVHGGNYTLKLKQGSDGNTIISQCAVATPAGGELHFSLKDTVNAVFSKNIQYQCNQVALSFQHPGGNGINYWDWTNGSGQSSSTAGFAYEDSTFKDQHVQLMVSNGLCADTAAEVIALNQNYFIRAGFEEPNFVCPNDEVTFVDKSEGEVTAYLWDFGNGQNSFLKTPTKQHYPEVITTRNFTVKQIVTNVIGCRDTAVQLLKVINNCFIDVPTAFTPNGDGMNDYLYPLNAYKAKDLDFRIYNRFGELIYRTSDWTRKWDGTFHGKPQPMGSYVWMLTFINTDTNERVFKKGATLLIR